MFNPLVFFNPTLTFPVPMALDLEVVPGKAVLDLLYPGLVRFLDSFSLSSLLEATPLSTLPLPLNPALPTLALAVAQLTVRSSPNRLTVNSGLVWPGNWCRLRLNVVRGGVSVRVGLLLLALEVLTEGWGWTVVLLTVRA